MKKVLLVVPSLSIGGQEKAVVDTAKVLQSTYDVSIVLFHKNDVEYETPNKKEYLDVGPSKTRIGRIIGQIKRAFKLSAIRNREKADIVYSFGETANLTNIISGVFSRGKSVISIHGFSSVYKSFINKFVFKKANSIICISKEMQRALLEIYPFIQNSVVIENGYDIDAIQAKSEEFASLEFGEPQFITMGRMEEVKGFDRLIKAFSNVLKSFPKARLTLIGTGSLEAELKELVASLGAEDNITFAGYQKNPHAYLSKADVFVLSSINEGFPNALVESLACGLACVCVDCQSGPREILSEEYTPKPISGVVEEKYGILCEQSKDTDVVVRYLSEAMKLIASDREKMKEYKEISVSRAQSFSCEAYKNKLERLFETIID